MVFGFLGFVTYFLKINQVKRRKKIPSCNAVYFLFFFIPRSEYQRSERTIDVVDPHSPSVWLTQGKYLVEENRSIDLLLDEYLSRLCYFFKIPLSQFQICTTLHAYADRILIESSKFLTLRDPPQLCRQVIKILIYFHVYP